MHFFFVLNQRRGIGCFVAIGGKHVHRGDDLAVRIHHDIYLEAAKRLAVFAKAGVRIGNTYRPVAPVLRCSVPQDFASHPTRFAKFPPSGGVFVRGRQYLGPVQNVPEVIHAQYQSLVLSQPFVAGVYHLDANPFPRNTFRIVGFGCREQFLANAGHQLKRRWNRHVGNHVGRILQTQTIFDQTLLARLSH